MSLRLQGGSLLLDTGALANSEACCCDCNCTGGNGAYQLQVVISGTPVIRNWNCTHTVPTSCVPSACPDPTGTLVFDCDTVDSGGLDEVTVCSVTCGIFGGYSVAYRVSYAVSIGGSGFSFTLSSFSVINPIINACGLAEQNCTKDSTNDSRITCTGTFTYAPGESFANGNCPTGVSVIQSPRGVTENACDISGLSLAFSLI